MGRSHEATADLVIELATTQAKHGERLIAVEKKATETYQKLDKIQLWIMGVLASTLVSTALLLANVVYHLAEKGALKGLIP